MSMREARFKAVIFDMDGLLVASEQVWETAEQDLMSARGITLTSADRAAIVGLRVDEFMAVLKERFRLTDSVPDLAQELNQRMLALIPHHVKPQAGAAEILAWVRAHNIPHALASNSSYAIIEATLLAQGWGDLFPVRCSGDDETHGKPAPDVYLTTARKLGVSPSACVALEDSRNGARAVVAAGMTCYAVPDLSHADAAVFAQITPHVFADLHQVLARLQAEDGFSAAAD
jgi:mannitol-1-/sugar-/sorbitol-6-/2-deoxyglucose-6-phosphatase